MPFKIYESLTSRIFYLIFSDHGSPWVTETIENENVDKRDTVFSNVPRQHCTGKDGLEGKQTQTVCCKPICFTSQGMHFLEKKG